MVHHDTNLYDLEVRSGTKAAVIHTTSNYLFWDLTIPSDHDFYITTTVTAILAHNFGGGRPPSLSPPSAGRQGAFNQA